MEARVPDQPVAHLLLFMRRVIIDDAVNVQMFRRIAVDGFQECQKFLMAMMRFMHWPITLPFSTSSAAKSVVVPLRL